MDVPNAFIINDTRKANEFHKMTYSGYLKKDVFDILFKKIDESSLEDVCVWCVEAVISGYFEDLWEKIILYYVKYININSPYVPYHIFIRLNQFLKLSKVEDFKTNFLDMRNSQEIRNHFCELLCMITNATKMRKPIPLSKINGTDFSKNVFEAKLRAKDYSNSLKMLTNNDPQEMTIIVNEFSYHISDNHYNINQAIYWLSWILEWEKTNIKKYGHYHCDSREVRGIENKCKRDFIWIFWEIILAEADKRNNEYLDRQVRSLMEFYKYKYTSSKKRKRIYIFINAIQVLSPEFKFNNDMLKKYPIYEKYHLVIQACANINVIYKEKKKDENLENNIINSKIKQDATYCVTKFSEINLLNDREPTKPRYKREINFKQMEKEKKKLERKIKEKNKMLKMEDKFNLLNTIDNSILGDKNRVVLAKNISKPNTYDIFTNNNSKTTNENKTINILDEIDRKIKNKGKKINGKTKEVFISKKE
jgi:hypothetical protein